jgi:predicted transcriptional regulator
MKDIREQLSIFLAEADVSAYRLAKESGVTRATISYILSGKQNDVCMRTAQDLHQAMVRIDSKAAKKAFG